MHGWLRTRSSGRSVTIGEGAVVGARASVFRSVDPWTVVGGVPRASSRNMSLSRRNHDRYRDCHKSINKA